MSRAEIAGVISLSMPTKWTVDTVEIEGDTEEGCVIWCCCTEEEGVCKGCCCDCAGLEMCVCAYKADDEVVEEY